MLVVVGQTLMNWIFSGMDMGKDMNTAIRTVIMGMISMVMTRDIYTTIQHL